MAGTGGRRTLVTGGAGFIGSYVARALLDAGREVLVLDVQDFPAEALFVLGAEGSRARLVRGSVADRTLLFDAVAEFRPDEIVHLAMVLDPQRLAREPDSGFDVNVGGTVNVLEAARRSELRRLVNISSIGVLPQVQYEPIDAAHPIFLSRSGPGTGLYGAHKAAGEALCFAYEREFGVDFRTIRPSAVYGLGMNRFPRGGAAAQSWAVSPIKDLVEGAVRGERVRLESGGAHPRDYTHASDIGSLVVAILDGPDDADRIFYGATGEPLVTATRVAEIVNRLIAGADVAIEPALSDAERSVRALRGRLSVSNAREQLSWEPRYSWVGDGIVRYAEDYRAFLAPGSLLALPERKAEA